MTGKTHMRPELFLSSSFCPPMSITVQRCGTAVYIASIFTTCQFLHDALASLTLSPLLRHSRPRSPHLRADYHPSHSSFAPVVSISLFLTSNLTSSISHSFPYLSSSTSFLRDYRLHCLLASPYLSFCFSCPPLLSIPFLLHASF